MNTEESNEPTLDPKEVAAVAALKEAMDAGHVDLLGIGRAKILEARSETSDRYPPSRTTILRIELKHKA